LVLFVVSIALAFSAFYELIEWWVALLSDEAADAFLGTQGYVWDTQSDMLMALIGAICTVVFLSRWHDVQLSGKV
jgi:putative membrane protein